MDLSRNTQELLDLELARLSSLAGEGVAGVAASTDTIRGYQAALGVLRSSGLSGPLDPQDLARAHELLGAARVTSAFLVGDSAFHRALSRIQDLVPAA